MAVSLVLWSPTVMPSYRIECIELDPRRVKGDTHRYTIAGSGFVNLIAGGRHANVITRSRVGDISEQRARAYGNEAGVDWSALRKLSRKIEYHVRKRMAEAKTTARSILVLSGAYALVNDGVELREAAGALWKYEVPQQTGG